MTFLKIATLVLLAGFTAAHLVGSWKENEKLRRITKPFLLLFILAFYLLSADTPSIWLTLALITSWLGDVLLMPHGHKWFTMGGISFLISHIMFICEYVQHVDFSRAILPAAIPAGIVYAAIAAAIMKALVPTTPKPMVIPMGLYLLCNGTMNTFALILLTSLRSAGAVTAYIGAVLFFISDCTLYIVRYYKKKDVVFKNHFTVMLTYVLGEFLITLGVLYL